MRAIIISGIMLTLMEINYLNFQTIPQGRDNRDT